MNKNKPGMINKHILDAKQFNIEVLPPNINQSKMNFSVANDKILFGYSAISGIGETLAETMLAERNAHGKFMSFDNFLERVQPTKSQVISLVKSGAIPTTNKRKFLVKYLSSMYQKSEYKPVATLPTKAKLLLEWDIDTTEYMIGRKVDKERVLDVYNAKKKAKFDEEQNVKYQAYVTECTEKYLKDEAFWEFETLQIFVSDENPFAQAYDILDDFSMFDTGDKCVIVGIVASVQKKKTKTGSQFAFANIYSGDGLIEVTIWPDALQKFQGLIAKGQQVAILGKKEGEDKMIVDKIKSYNQWLFDVSKKRFGVKF
jgi:DNA polymerase-3 subunit alpha